MGNKTVVSFELLPPCSVLTNIGMTLAQVKEVILNIRYKKNFSFRITGYPRDIVGHFDDGYWILFVEWTVPNADLPGKPILVQTSRVLPPKARLNEESLVQFVWTVVLEAEKHEAGHFFSYRDVTVFNEHEKQEFPLIGISP